MLSNARRRTRENENTREKENEKDKKVTEKIKYRAAACIANVSGDHSASMEIPDILSDSKQLVCRAVLRIISGFRLCESIIFCLVEETTAAVHRDLSGTFCHLSHIV